MTLNCTPNNFRLLYMYFPWNDHWAQVSVRDFVGHGPQFIYSPQSNCLLKMHQIANMLNPKFCCNYIASTKSYINKKPH